MFYVYLIRSISNPKKTYIGYTTDLKHRLATHNSGGSVYTAANRPWELVLYLVFNDETRAVAFEKYLKSGAGNAFAKKHLWEVFFRLKSRALRNLLPPRRLMIGNNQT